MKRCNGVFEGGGVRGIGHVGAVWEMERAGYRFADLAGSSAGAIVAALMAAGYSGRELKTEMESLDYMKMKGKDFIDYFGTVGKLCSILLHFGIYNTDYLEQWMEELLWRKGIRTFGDVNQTGRRLKITASDLTAERLLILPDDLMELGIDSGSFSVAAAVRMSVSIPVFFEPVKLRDRDGGTHIIVDGGLLSNFPMWVFEDDHSEKKWPTLGFRFSDDRGSRRQLCSGSWNLVDYLKAIAATCMDATDRSLVVAGDQERTIVIPAEVKVNGESRTIRAVDFEITKEERNALFENGKKAAQTYLRTILCRK